MNAGRSTAALLTDEAVWAAAGVRVDGSPRKAAGAALAAFLRFHATEGREALVERVARALRDPSYGGPLGVWERKRAEAVVSALVGES